MPPVKFDDIPKPANEVLNDDYVSSYQLKAKQKTSWGGAVATTTVDIVPGSTTATPAKLSWKFPKPLGLAGVCVDKLDFAKDGKYALEVTCDKASHKIDNFTVTGKSDLASMAKSSISCTYTGIKDTGIKLDAKPANLTDCTLEVVHAMKDLTLGAKLTQKTLLAPDLSARFTYNRGFGALTAKDAFSKFSIFGMYKVQDDVKVAGTCTIPTKGNLSYGVGGVYDVLPGVKVKGKLEQAEALSASLALKYEVSKGFTVTSGGKVTMGSAGKAGATKIGVQVSIE